MATKEKAHSLSPFENQTLEVMISRKNEDFLSKTCNICSLITMVCAAGDQTDSNVIYVVPSVAGGLVLIFVVIAIWWGVRIRCRNNDYPPLIPDNPGGGVEEIVNNYPDTSEGSELTSGRNSASLTKLPSPGSSCSDITVAKKDQSFNGKAKMKSYTEESC